MAKRRRRRAPKRAHFERRVRALEARQERQMQKLKRDILHAVQVLLEEYLTEEDETPSGR